MKLKKSIGLFCLLAVLLVSFVSQASAENVKFKTGKCSFSLPVYGAYEKFEADWKGPCLNGLAEGEGLITYSIEFTDKTKYEVEGKVAMKQGLLDGRGVLNFSNGDRYDLNFVGGEPKNGTVVRSDGRKYEGEFYKDYAHGKGVFTAADGSSYDGYFQMDKPHGYGVQRDKNGKIIYEGEWLNGFYANDPAATRTLTGFLGMEWETERKLAEKTLNKRPGTEYVDMLFLGKFYGYGDKLPSPQKGRYYTVTGKFNNEPAELTVWFFEDKLAGGRASFFNAETDIMLKYEEARKNLIEKYGPPNSEGGKGSDAWTRWLFIDSNCLDLYIRKLGYEAKPNLPADKKKPFNLTIEYKNTDLMNKISPQPATPTTSDF